jgi:NAD(P)-dependent dehydrogenase (short-subunit alcohol dehydrogenase family)
MSVDADKIILKSGRTKEDVMRLRGKAAVITGSPVYCASKGAVVQLMRALALDYAAKNIRVNAICPGIIDTDMFGEFVRAMPDPAQARAAADYEQPLGRLGTPQECADAALWLVSDEASFVTGVALPVDGGITAM